MFLNPYSSVVAGAGEGSTGSTQQPLDHGSHRVVRDPVEVVHATSEPTGWPDVYVNFDGTMTVDPVDQDFWILDHSNRHSISQTAGALKDHAGVMAVQHLVDEMALPETSFVPTSQHLEVSDKFTGLCVSNSTRGWSTQKKNGKLPPISKLMWENALQDKPDWMIEPEFWNGRELRTFDCAGSCR